MLSESSRSTIIRAFILVNIVFGLLGLVIAALYMTDAAGEGRGKNFNYLKNEYCANDTAVGPPFYRKPIPFNSKLKRERRGTIRYPDKPKYSVAQIERKLWNNICRTFRKRIATGTTGIGVGVFQIFTGLCLEAITISIFKKWVPLEEKTFLIIAITHFIYGVVWIIAFVMAWSGSAVDQFLTTSWGTASFKESIVLIQGNPPLWPAAEDQIAMEVAYTVFLINGIICFSTAFMAGTLFFLDQSPNVVVPENGEEGQEDMSIVSKDDSALANAGIIESPVAFALNTRASAKGLQPLEPLISVKPVGSGAHRSVKDRKPTTFAPRLFSGKRKKETSGPTTGSPKYSGPNSSNNPPPASDATRPAGSS